MASSPVLLSIVYRFLVSAGEKKAAKALRKAHPDADWTDGPTLEELHSAAPQHRQKQVPEEAPAKANGDHKDKKKKRKHQPEPEPEPASGPSAEPAVADQASAPAANGGASPASAERRKEKKSKTQERFQRVDPTTTEIADPRLLDHSHASKLNDEWGTKADAVLSKVRGKDFRHEKTKKKRGTYKGGAITTSVNSIKFDDSD